MGLNCVGPLTCRCFSINILKHFLEISHNLKKYLLSSSLPVRIQYIICITYAIGVNQLFRLTVRFPINRRLLIVKFWGSQSCMWIFDGTGAGAPDPPALQGSAAQQCRPSQVLHCRTGDRWFGWTALLIRRWSTMYHAQGLENKPRVLLLAMTVVSAPH